MLAGDFARKLKKLNKELKIFCGNDDSKPAGLFRVVQGEYEQICSIDKNYVPKYAVVDETNHIVKAGWQRVLKLLILKKLVDPKQVKKEFGSLDVYMPKIYDTTDKLEKEIKEIENRRIYHGEFDKKGKAKLRRNDILDIQEAIKDARR